jgi:bifunctional DNA-binding transcriptional regulator/antitoxin component of YhaV-PrlF toxin-antitoxin module
VRPKNQVTIPKHALEAGGLRVGDPITFEPIQGGGVVIRPYVNRSEATLGDLARKWSNEFRDVADIDLDSYVGKRVVVEPRDIEW